MPKQIQQNTRFMSLLCPYLVKIQIKSTAIFLYCIYVVLVFSCLLYKKYQVRLPTRNTKDSVKIDFFFITIWSSIKFMTYE